MTVLEKRFGVFGAHKHDKGRAERGERRPMNELSDACVDDRDLGATASALSGRARVAQQNAQLATSLE